LKALLGNWFSEWLKWKNNPMTSHPNDSGNQTLHPTETWEAKEFDFEEVINKNMDSALSIDGGMSKTGFVSKMSTLFDHLETADNHSTNDANNGLSYEGNLSKTPGLGSLLHFN
jgi:hypothetical protein